MDLDYVTNFKGQFAPLFKTGKKETSSMNWVHILIIDYGPESFSSLFYFFD